MVQKVGQILLSKGCDGRRGGVGVTDLQLIRKTREGMSDIWGELWILATHTPEVSVGSVLGSVP